MHLVVAHQRPNTMNMQHIHQDPVCHSHLTGRFIRHITSIHRILIQDIIQGLTQCMGCLNNQVLETCGLVHQDLTVTRPLDLATDIPMNTNKRCTNIPLNRLLVLADYKLKMAVTYQDSLISHNLHHNKSMDNSRITQTILKCTHQLHQELINILPTTSKWK